MAHLILPKFIHKFLQSELTQKIYLSTILTHLIFNFTIENGDEKAKKQFVRNLQRDFFGFQYPYLEMLARSSQWNTLKSDVQHLSFTFEDFITRMLEMSAGWAVFHPLSSPSVKPFRICVNISMISSYTVLKSKIFQNFCQYFQVLISSPSARNIFLGWRRRHKSNQLNRLEHRAASHESDFLLFCAAVFFDIYCNSCQNISLYRCLCKKNQAEQKFLFSFVHAKPDGLPLGRIQQV